MIILDETRIIIAGSRYFTDYDLLKKKCAKISELKNPVIISGHAKGADVLGERFAREHNIPLKIFPANWEKYGNKAGPIRNEEMAKYASKANKSYLVAFPLGESRGTMNMINVAKQHGLKVYVVHS